MTNMLQKAVVHLIQVASQGSVQTNNKFLIWRGHAHLQFQYMGICRWSNVVRQKTSRIHDDSVSTICTYSYIRLQRFGIGNPIISRLRTHPIPNSNCIRQARNRTKGYSYDLIYASPLCARKERKMLEMQANNPYAERKQELNSQTPFDVNFSSCLLRKDVDR